MIEIKISRDNPEAEAQEARELFNGEVPQSVFDDVAELQQITAMLGDSIISLEEQVSGELLTTGQDLNDLDTGLYIIPTSTVSGSLLNKPISSTATGYIKVVAGGSSGQKVMYYVPCAASPTYYQRAYFSGAWQPWIEVSFSDSGWRDLPLSNGAKAYNSVQVPQYRKINNQVFIRGVFNGITSRCTVAVLPVGFRPSQRLMINLPRTGYLVTRFEIETTGEINYIGSSETITSDTWFSFSDTNFL